MAVVGEEAWNCKKRWNCVKRKQKSEENGSKWKDGVKILKEERQHSVGGEGFSQGFGEEAKGKTDKCGEMKGKW